MKLRRIGLQFICTADVLLKLIRFLKTYILLLWFLRDKYQGHCLITSTFIAVAKPECRVSDSALSLNLTDLHVFEGYYSLRDYETGFCNFLKNDRTCLKINN